MDFVLKCAFLPIHFLFNIIFALTNSTFFLQKNCHRIYAIHLKIHLVEQNSNAKETHKRETKITQHILNLHLFYAIKYAKNLVDFVKKNVMLKIKYILEVWFEKFATGKIHATGAINYSLSTDLVTIPVLLYSVIRENVALNLENLNADVK